MDSKIEKIRASCTIEWAWKILDLPGRPARTCKSPFREDKKPSFSVYMAKDGQRWYDQGTGEGGDVVDFWAAAKGITLQAAIDELGLMMGIEAKRHTARYRTPEKAKEKPEEKPVQWPSDLRMPTIAECESLGMLRDLPAAAFDVAALLGFLKVGTHKGELLWFLTDASKQGAEGKTFTGDPCLASGKKTAALPGTSKSWCYGLMSDREEWNAIDKLVIVEGLPDFFAALAILIDYPGNARPISMLGASTRPGDECRPFINDRECLIIGHNDTEGRRAIDVWRKRLQELGASNVHVQDLPEGYKDLCEFVSVNEPEQTLQVLKGFSCERRA
jgi:DNA primase